MDQDVVGTMQELEVAPGGWKKKGGKKWSYVTDLGDNYVGLTQGEF